MSAPTKPLRASWADLLPAPLRRAPADAQARGVWAEDRAAWHLRCRGWRLCARNWRHGRHELDLVLARWRTLLVVEVRQRSDGDPLASIDRAKLNRTISAARALVRLRHLHAYRLRLDLLAVDRQGRIRRARDVLNQGLLSP
jgi:putative endonuclease